MPALTSDPTVTGATLVALAASRSPGGGFAVAADVRRFAGWEFYRVATLHCEVPGAATEHQVVRASALTVEQIRGRTPAAVAMAYLDAHLTQPPYLLATHQAGPLASLIAGCAKQCPALAAARLLDTAELARQLRGTPAQVGLEAYAEQFHVPRASLATVADRAGLTAQLFTSLARQEPPTGADPTGLLERCAPASRLELTARTS
ncbi:MAG TPA: hypothetical protein VL551_10405 [Actinospica sp.]|nr:hypothetical protein [Actinospica sp.]